MDIKKAKVLLWLQQQIMEIIRKMKARLNGSFKVKSTGPDTGQTVGDSPFLNLMVRGRHRSQGKRLSPVINNKRLAFPHPGNQDKDEFYKTTLKLVRLWTSEWSSHSGITRLMRVLDSYKHIWFIQQGSCISDSSKQMQFIQQGSPNVWATRKSA